MDLPSWVEARGLEQYLMLAAPEVVFRALDSEFRVQGLEVLAGRRLGGPSILLTAEVEIKTQERCPERTMLAVERHPAAAVGLSGRGRDARH